MSNLGRWLVLGGLGLVLAGGIVWLLGRSGLPLGRLPGDLHFETSGVSCFIPLATSLLLSVLLTLVLNVIARFFK
ncbi:MAG: DUF2905 family protein [Anaerolineales bacterium]